MRSSIRNRALLGTVAVLSVALAACGSKKSDDTTAVSEAAASAETAAPAAETAAPAAETAAPAAETAAPVASETTATADPAAPTSGAGIKLAVNPWTGSKVNSQVAKLILESKLGTPTELVDVDENATWPGLDSGQLDAVLEVWPSGHTKDRATYIDEKKTVVDMGLLGPNAKIGWYVPDYVAAEHPELLTWEGYKNADAAKMFATAESGDQGQFLMGDPSYVSYDEQIIRSLNLPLKFVVSGSEAAEITAIKQAVADKKPILVQFWQPHWLHSVVKLVEVKLPDVTPECSASATAKDGKYACDYPVDNIYKAASAKLAEKNAAAYAFLQKFQLTTEQQNAIAAKIDAEGKAADVAAKEWVDANAGVVNAWLA